MNSLKLIIYYAFNTNKTLDSHIDISLKNGVEYVLAQGLNTSNMRRLFSLQEAWNPKGNFFMQINENYLNWLIISEKMTLLSKL